MARDFKAGQLPQGPSGPRGPAGSDAQFNGAAAGGGLAGTYPNPAIDPGAVGTAQLRAIPTVRVSSAEQATASGPPTVLALPGEAFDVGDMHDQTTNNSRLVAPVAGVYLVTANVKWRASGAGTQRYATIRVNGGSDDEGINQVAPVISIGAFTSLIASTQVRLAAGDYVEVYVLQDSGATLSVVVGSPVQMTWIAPG